MDGRLKDATWVQAFEMLERKNRRGPTNDKFPLHLRTVSFRVAQIACLYEQCPSFSIVLANYQVPGNFTSVAPFPQAIPHHTRTCKSMGPSGGFPSRPRVPVLSDAFSAAARTAARADFCLNAPFSESSVSSFTCVCVCVVWSSSHERRDVRRDRFQCF